jgi:phage terminase Nu1 subunit (DNA packaging protein)
MTEQKQNLAEIAKKKRHLHLIEKLHNGKALTKQEIAELEQFEAEPLAPTVVKTLEEVAKVMDVSYRTVYRWKKDGMPVTGDGFYDLEQIKTWHTQKKDKSKNPATEGKDFWDEKIRKYKAAMLELELKKATGDLVSKDEVEKGRITRVIAIKRTLLALPTRLAPALAMKEPREIEAVLYEALSEIVDEFAGTRRLQDEVCNENGGQDNLVGSGKAGVETPGKDNGQPVG